MIENKDRFSRWFNRMLKYEFIEDKDFFKSRIFTLVNNEAKRELQDYSLTIDMVKEILILQRETKGERYRKYLIECEKKLKETQLFDNTEIAKRFIEEQQRKQSFID